MLNAELMPLPVVQWRNIYIFCQYDAFNKGKSRILLKFLEKINVTVQYIKKFIICNELIYHLIKL